MYLAPVGGGPEQRLTDHPAEDMLPRFTHDGRRVLFASRRTGRWQVWEVDAGGGEARRVRANAHTEYQVAESPGGRELAFLSDEPGSEALLVSGRDGSGSRVLFRPGGDAILGNPDWSPDGGRIVFSSNHRLGHHVYLLDVARAAVRRLGALSHGSCEPRFHPDGRRVVHVSRGHLHSERSRLVEVDLESGRETVLVAWPALNYGPVYSPDGSELAFASDVSGESQVYRLRLADRQAWQVTFPPGSARAPDYRPRPSEP